MTMLPLVAATLLAASHQVDSTAVIRGKASSSFNGRPLVGVMISVPAARKFVVSDSNGQFRLTGLPSGLQHIRVSYEGRETGDFQFVLQPMRQKRIAVLLDVEAYDLSPLVVEVRGANYWRDLAGFYERRGWYRGFARF